VITTEELSELVRAQQTIPNLFSSRVAELGDKPFINWQSRVLSYRDMDLMASQVANSLSSLGIGRSSRVALMMTNSPEWIAIWLGTMKIGAVLVSLNTAYKGAGLAYQLNDSAADVLIIDSAFTPRIRDISDKIAIKHVFVGGEPDGLRPEELELSVLFGSATDAPAVDDIAASSPATILYTSGTTGPPKGCLLPHGQYVAAAYLHANHCGYGRDTTIYTCLPLFHINAQNYTILSAVAAGGTVALDNRFTASGFWNRLIDSRATAFNFIGSMATSLWNQQPKPEEKQHRAAVAVGVPVSNDIWDMWEKRFNCRIIYAYGMTENALPTMIDVLDTPVKLHLHGSGGKASPTSEVAIVDDNDYQVPAGQLGEIVTRPKIPWTMMLEYLNKPTATIEAFRGCWFHTGDVGWLDDEGYLFYADRKKDALRRRGEMISSWDVETTVRAYPDVEDCAVIGVPAELGEDEVMVVIVSKNPDFDPAALIKYCKETMAEFQVPRYVRLVDELPRTQTQRVEKYRLRQEGITEDTWDAAPADALRMGPRGRG
jgi:carnitine-CoA ligase